MSPKNQVILIIVIGIIVMFVITFAIPAVLHRQPDRLGIILYNCAMGFERSGSLSLYMFDNGTHTIDENSCQWKKNRIP